MPIINRVADLHPDITAWRRDLHAHPELLFDVQRTAGTVTEKLKAFGCDEVVTCIGRTGVVGIIRGRKGSKGKTIGLRADMDALPIEEANELPYKSTVPGKMHACGHDGHMATLMGTALEGLNRSFMKSVSFMGGDVLYVDRGSWFMNSYQEWLESQKRPALTLSTPGALTTHPLTHSPTRSLAHSLTRSVAWGRGVAARHA